MAVGVGLTAIASLSFVVQFWLERMLSLLMVEVRRLEAAVLAAATEVDREGASKTARLASREMAAWMVEEEDARIDEREDAILALMRSRALLASANAFVVAADEAETCARMFVCAAFLDAICAAMRCDSCA